MTKSFFSLLIIVLFYSFYEAFVKFWIAFHENDFDGMVIELFFVALCVAGACAVYAAWRELRKSRRRAET